MENSKKIVLACKYCNISQAELARRINTTPQLLNSRLKTNKFTNGELEQIAKVLGAEYISTIKFPDGTEF